MSAGRTLLSAPAEEGDPAKVNFNWREVQLVKYVEWIGTIESGSRLWGFSPSAARAVWARYESFGRVIVGSCE